MQIIHSDCRVGNQLQLLHNCSTPRFRTKSRHGASGHRGVVNKSMAQSDRGGADVVVRHLHSFLCCGLPLRCHQKWLAGKSPINWRFKAWDNHLYMGDCPLLCLITGT